MNTWKNWTVSYWTHEKNFGINDCFGNSINKTVKARSLQEAVKKVMKVEKGIFRFRKATYEQGGAFVEFGTY